MRANFPKHFFISDVYKRRRKKTYQRQMQICDFLARASLKEGFFAWKNLKNHNKVKQFWQFDSIPPSKSELEKYTVKHLIWYLQNHVSEQHKIWNSSFLHGLAQSGKLTRPQKSFYKMSMYSIKRFKYIMQICPFGGKLVDYGPDDGIAWLDVPALALPYDEKSMSFMAGVFSMGQEYEKDGLIYAKYSGKCEKWFRLWGIPIEGYTPNKLGVLISPFWPSLLHEWMPPLLRTWRRIKHAANAHKYAAILWKVYQGTKFKREEIPYLACVEYYFDNFSSNDYTLSQNLKRMWIECGLTMMDDRVKNLIRTKNFV